MSTPHFRRLARLHSKQGVDITISYGIAIEYDSGRPYYKAVDIAFGCQAHGALLAGNVSLVLINRYFSEDVFFQREKVWVVPMHMADMYMGITILSGGTIAEADAQFAPSDFYIKCHPQVAVVVNGEWQIDPIQSGEQHNFNFDWILYPD